MKALALAAIRVYQRCISPYKGFCCAYAATTGHGSCSALGYRAIRRFGLWRGLGVLDNRLEKCGVAYRRYRAAPPMSALGSQAGFLDCSCDGPGDCDGPCDCGPKGNGARVAGGVLDCAVDLLPCDCDWKKKRKRDRREREIIIPPRRNRR